MFYLTILRNCDYLHLYLCHSPKSASEPQLDRGPGGTGISVEGIWTAKISRLRMLLYAILRGEDLRLWAAILEANLPPDRPCLLRLRRDGLRNLSAASPPGGRFGLQAVTTTVTPRRRCHR